MANNTTCDYLTNTTWPKPPYFTYSAITWLAPENKTASETLQKCCGGSAQPLQFYENDCLVWCETGDYWSKVFACTESYDSPYHLFLGYTEGSYIMDRHDALFMFPSEPKPPFAREELKSPYTKCRQTRVLKIDYCVAEVDAGFSKKSNEEEAAWLDDKVESVWLSQLRAQCEGEMQKKQQLVDEARGWFRGWLWQNETMMQEARDMKIRSCELLHEIDNHMARLYFIGRKSNWVGLVIFVVICCKLIGIW